MRTIRPLPVLLALAAAAPGTAQAATPFDAGVGHDPRVAVGADGAGHVVWMTDEAGDRVGYCRVPRDGSACSATAVLSFPGGAAAVGAETPQVFAPAPGKVVVVAGCFNCNPSGATDRVFRWISTDNGARFGAPAQVGLNLRLDGDGTYVDAGDVFAGVERHQLLGTPVAGTPNPVDHAPSGFAFGAAVTRVPGADQLVAVANDLDAVRFHVYAGPLDGASISAPANWPGSQLLPGATADNSETSVGAGSAGVFLGYRRFVPLDNRLVLHRYDPARRAFGAGVEIQGDDPIDNSVDYPDVSAAGRVHAVWRSLHDGGRLRYTSSAGAGFSPPANLATRETFIDPEVAAAVDGSGFAVWQDIGTSPIRVVALDPEPEPGSPVLGGGVTARVVQGRIRVRVAGRVAGRRCRGRVRITIRRGGTVLARRSARIRRNCRFATTVVLRRRSARTLRVTVRRGARVASLSVAVRR